MVLDEYGFFLTLSKNVASLISNVPSRPMTLYSWWQGVVVDRPPYNRIATKVACSNVSISRLDNQFGMKLYLTLVVNFGCFAGQLLKRTWSLVIWVTFGLLNVWKFYCTSAVLLCVSKSLHEHEKVCIFCTIYLNFQDKKVVRRTTINRRHFA